MTHYEFPTLLANATLRVDVVSWRLFGHGPIVRSVLVLPAPPPKHHHKHDDKSVRQWPRTEEEYEAVLEAYEAGALDESTPPPPPAPECDCPKGEPPIKAVASDVTARNGAIHVINKIVRPPMPHRPKQDGLKAQHHRGHHGKNALENAIAHLFE